MAAHSPSSTSSKSKQRSKHDECVKALIPAMEASEHVEALRWASENGHAGCARLLLPHVDCSQASAQKIFKEAIVDGWAAIVSAMASREPDLLRLVDYEQSIDCGLRKGNLDIVNFLSAMRDKEKIVDVCDSLEKAPANARKARL